MPAIFVDSFGGMEYPSRFTATDSVFLFIRCYEGDTSSLPSGSEIIRFEISNPSDALNSTIAISVKNDLEVSGLVYDQVSEVYPAHDLALTDNGQVRNIGFWVGDGGSALYLNGASATAASTVLGALGRPWTNVSVKCIKDPTAPAVDRYRNAHIQTVALYTDITQAEAEAMMVPGSEPSSPVYPDGLPLPLRNVKSRNQPAPYRVDRPRRSMGYTREIGSDTPVFWDLQWRFTRAQAYEFIQWFENDLERGAQPFIMSLKTEFGMIEHACRFLPDSLLPTQDTGESWEYTATIMTRGEIIPELFIDNADAIIAIENWNGTIPGDPLWTNVARLVQFGDTPSGANFKDWKTDTAGVLYTDGTAVETFVTRTDTQTLGTAPSMRWTYQASAAFSNRILTFPASSAHMIPSGQDFTVEAWVRGNRVGTMPELNWVSVIRSYSTIGSGVFPDWELGIAPDNLGPGFSQSFAPIFAIESGVLLRATGVVGVNNSQWHHIAVSRFGSDWRMFLNGQSVSVLTPMGAPSGFTGNFGSASSKLCLMGREDNNGGGSPNCYGFGLGGLAGPDDLYDGYLGAARLTVGVARYWANFTPTAEPFPSNAEIVVA